MIQPLLGMYPEKTLNSKRYMHPSVHCSTIYNSQVMEATKCPLTDEWIKKKTLTIGISTPASNFPEDPADLSELWSKK